MNAACRDSAEIGAGYEDDLKSGKYTKAGCVEEEGICAIVGCTRQIFPCAARLFLFVIFSCDKKGRKALEQKSLT